MLLASGSPGIRARGAVEDYPARGAMPIATIGAALIPAAESKKILGVDLNAAGYMVVEVGIFPAPGKDVDLRPDDFTLETDPDQMAARPVDDEAIASTIERRQNPPQHSQRLPGDIYPSAGATIGHGTWTDPATGRRNSDTITGVSTGVGVGAPPPMACGGMICDPSAPYPASSGSTANRNQMEQELWSKALPDGVVHNAVAGYLYFPKPSGKAKKNQWVLRWDNLGARVKIELPKSAR